MNHPSDATIHSIQQRIAKLRAALDQAMQCVSVEVDALRQELLTIETTVVLREMDLDKKLETWNEIRGKLSNVTAQQGTIAKLNVGGHYFETSVQTLTSIPDSMFSAMFSGQYVIEKDDSGRYFIDRDGKHFDVILNYLRDGYLDCNIDDATREKLLREARFYCLNPLVCILEGTTPQFPKVTWDNVTPQVVVDSTGTHITTTSSTWVHAWSNLRMVSGVYYWEVKITTYDTKNSLNIALGITKEPLKVSCIMGYSYNPESWGYIVGTGRVAHNKSYSIEYAESSVEGDVIGIKVDLRRHTLEFFRNGVSLGVAFSNVTGPVYPAVSLVNKQQITALYPPQTFALHEPHASPTPALDPS